MAVASLQRIRDLLNNSWRKEVLFSDKIKWNKAWSSLDTIEDTQVAIDSYCSLNDFNAYNNGYLYIYGILQALFLQQDALNSLNHVIFDKEINWMKRYPELHKIRDYRNDSIGHPTNRRNNKSFHRISRYSIKKTGFELVSYFPKQEKSSEFIKVDVMNCINIQSAILKNILDQSMKRLEEEYKNHKSKFLKNPIKKQIPTSFDYHIENLYKGAAGSRSTKVDFKIICNTIETITREVEKRFINIEALPNFEYIVNQIKYILNRLKETLILDKIEDQMELNIFIDALSNRFKEIFDIVTEIDREYSEM